MKNKFTHFLMAGALVCWSSYTLHAQTEVTDTYLKNPSFESNFTDWDNAGMQTQTNTSFSKIPGGGMQFRGVKARTFFLFRLTKIYA